MLFFKVIVGITTGLAFFPMQVETTTKAIQKAQSHEMEIPDPFFLITGMYETCANNALISSWCDSSHTSEHEDVLKCGILPQFHEYGCSCQDDPTMCPIECLEGSEIISKTRTNIRCRNIPSTEHNPPNYIMEEIHYAHRNDCSNHVLIEAWCDDYVNKHVECSIYPQMNQYYCRCSGSKSNTYCPEECLDGSDILIKTTHGIICTNIPTDTVNYELTD